MAVETDELLPSLPRSWSPPEGAPGSVGSAVSFISGEQLTTGEDRTTDGTSRAGESVIDELQDFLTDHSAKLVGGVAVAALVAGLLSGKIQFACSQILSKRLELPGILHGLLLLLAKVPSMALHGDVYIADEQSDTVVHDTLLKKAAIDGTLLWLLDGYDISSFSVKNGVFSCLRTRGLAKRRLIFYSRHRTGDGVVYEFLDGETDTVHRVYGVQRSIHQLEGHHVRYIAGVR